ncbi:MAG: ferredoxin-type protein NapF [endosymbiont of Escarpia spicata]|uniref:Ferredoxin-type protein NapF n=1 Tax=endosymbiont of Escarpia spicata TaxID=2200908 RepID=A0A370DND2_9GAMM|nr:MAG: ferredoxin-type protein NapF [endosymbiont of Escarpia spicata]
MKHHLIVSVNRTQFLRGDLRGTQSSIRPPWSKAEAEFVEKCERCDDCISECPQHIIQRGPGGFPRIDFSQGGCTFCGDCVKACTYKVLAFFNDLNQPPWPLKAVIADNCLSMQGVVCRSCGEVCDESAIRFKLEVGGKARPLLNSEDCTGCGECFAVCPSQSVTLKPQQQDQAA